METSLATAGLVETELTVVHELRTLVLSRHAAIAAALTEPEQHRFLAELRTAFEEGRATRRMAGAYVVAQLTPPTAA